MSPAVGTLTAEKPTVTANGPAPAPTPPAERRWVVPPEFIPDVTDIVIEDDTPVDNQFSEKNMRLLTEPLFASWAGPGEGRPFLVMANVGLFHTYRQPPIVPDVMLSLDVRIAGSLRVKENNTYFVWVLGKLPDVVLEIVSNREGGEDGFKLREYARINIPYYVIFDPSNLLGGGVLRIFELRGKKYHPLDTTWFEEIGLGVTLWEGIYEGMHDTWLRWCDRDGKVIPTGAESAVAERQRAEAERQRAEDALQEVERLRAQLRQLGAGPAEQPSPKASRRRKKRS